MIYPDTPANNALTLSGLDLKKVNDLMDTNGLSMYAMFRGPRAYLLEIKNGCATLEIIYPRHLPDSGRDEIYILKVLAYCLGKSLARINHLLLLEYEAKGSGAFIDFRFYTKEESRQKADDALSSSVDKKKIRDRIFDRNELIDLYK
ncbi:hypothetical protein [Gracilimonas mengyeensis]|uniref:Uncharacterized protein n=1 Tax=Gracilimonas mengyeensis TaxID=1302730 RepID=A0A521CIB2_9BACT|nr:hypothetical protein [Gracilimonas mengyeensis]SMO59158.1 hypothetical protein SAMN06265219_105187 [Gracilimonas mengyeensis]